MYLGILFMSEGKMKREIDSWFEASSAVMRTLKLSGVVKRAQSHKAKLSIYMSIYVRTLTYGHEVRVVTERMRWGIQGSLYR